MNEEQPRRALDPRRLKPNQVVALLTPVAAPLAGYVSTLLARHLPGIDVPREALEEIFLAGAAVAFGEASLWLWGWQKHEEREARRSVPAEVIDDMDLEAALAGRSTITEAGPAPAAPASGDELTPEDLVASDRDIDLDEGELALREAGLEVDEARLEEDIGLEEDVALEDEEELELELEEEGESFGLEDEDELDRAEAELMADGGSASTAGRS